MVASINASTSAGVVTTADTSGILALQTAGTTALTLDASQNATFAGTLTTTGITNSGVATATRFNPTGSSVTGNGMYLPAANSLGLSTNGTNAVYIDSSQNVGIGVTPSATNTGKAVEIGTVGNTLWGIGAADLQISAGTYYNGANKYAVTGSAVSAYELVSGSHRWYYAASGTAGNTASFSESMRITSNGTLCLGTTSQYGSNILSIQKSLLSSGSGAGTLINLFNDGATSGSRTFNSLMRVCSTGSGADCNIVMTDNTSYNYFFGGYNGTAYVTVGNSQGVKLSAGGTSWASDSDERLKNIKQPITNALANLGTLRTVYGNYKDDAEDVSRLFLIAQDVQKVYPEAIDVYTDEQQTLGLRAVDLIPVLVASIKELKAINDTQAETINALTARIVALEGR